MILLSILQWKQETVNCFPSTLVTLLRGFTTFFIVKHKPAKPEPRKLWQVIWCCSGSASRQLVIKNSPANAGDVNNGFDPWIRESLEEGTGNLLQYSCVENPMHRAAAWATALACTVGHYSAPTRWVPPCVCVFMSLSPKTSEDRNKTNKNTTNKNLQFSLAGELKVRSSKKSERYTVNSRPNKGDFYNSSETWLDSWSVAGAVKVGFRSLVRCCPLSSLK